MYREDDYNAADPNDIENEMNSPQEFLAIAQKNDRGFNIIYRKFISPKTGKPKNKRINIYTSGSVGSRIRDAESGDYYPNRVGSRDEDLFFKVILATGECNSPNGSSTLFYNSPQHYMSHHNCTIEPETISVWEAKRNARLSEMKSRKNAMVDLVEVR
jgi:hypothetical protein